MGIMKRIALEKWEKGYRKPKFKLAYLDGKVYLMPVVGILDKVKKQNVQSDEVQGE